MRVIKSRDGFGADARFATWAYAIARNRLIDHWRSARQWQQVSLDDDSDGANAIVDTLAGPEALEPYALSVRAESHDMLHEALARLPAAQRDAFCCTSRRADCEIARRRRRMKRSRAACDMHTPD